jgi:hypothetical protein
MKAVAEIPERLLDGRLAAASGAEDAASATRIAYAAQLAERGDHAAAAREAATLIEAGIHDIRLIGFYLFGLFVQRGIVQLPALLARVTALITDELEVLRPERRKLQVVNSAAAWLFEHVSAQLMFRAKQRDATWDAWCGERDGGLPDAIAAGCSKLIDALEQMIDAPLAAVPLARIRRWALEDLRRAMARREAAASVPPAAVVVGAKPNDAGRDDDDEAEVNASDATASWSALDNQSADAYDAVVAVGNTVPPRTRDAGPPRAGDEPVAAGSPALTVLQAKLAGFQTLVARRELARAAVVAGDLRATLASFDPITYFPSMFAAYFKTLHQVIDELGPYLDASDQPAWHALESYYRADLRAFIED